MGLKYRLSNSLATPSNEAALGLHAEPSHEYSFADVNTPSGRICVKVQYSVANPQDYTVRHMGLCCKAAGGSQMHLAIWRGLGVPVARMSGKWEVSEGVVGWWWWCVLASMPTLSSPGRLRCLLRALAPDGACLISSHLHRWRRPSSQLKACNGASKDPSRCPRKPPICKHCLPQTAHWVQSQLPT